VIVDAQVHTYAANTEDRPWCIDVERIEPREMTGEQMVAAMDEAGVDRAILVSAWTQYGVDPSYAESVYVEHPDRFRLVTPVDPRDHDIVEQIRHWAKQPGAVGLRVLFMPRTTWGADHPGLQAALRTAAEVGLVVNLFCWGHLPVADALVAAFPGTQVVLDHFGLEQHDVPPSPPDALADLDRVLALARHPNLALKLTGVCTYSQQGFPFEDLWEPVARAIDAYGIDRCLWGTDWQRSTRSYTYRDAVVAFRDRWPLSDADRAALLGANTLRIYNWDERG
jgi:predicted TIM-barrel fold metal-dependent hydrolase